MRAMATLSDGVILSAFNKEVDLNSDTIKCALFTNDHAPDQDVDQYYDGAHGMAEVVGDGYVAGGAAVGNPSIAYTGATNVFKFDGDDVSWNPATITARYAVIYDDTPAANKPMLCFLDFGEDRGIVNGPFTITFDADGISVITAS